MKIIQKTINIKGKQELESHVKDFDLRSINAWMEFKRFIQPYVENIENEVISNIDEFQKVLNEEAEKGQNFACSKEDRYQVFQTGRRLKPHVYNLKYVAHFHEIEKVYEYEVLGKEVCQLELFVVID